MKLKTTKEKRERERLKKLKLSIRAIKPKVVKFNHRLLVKEVDRVFSHYIRFVRDKDK